MNYVDLAAPADGARCGRLKVYLNRDSICASSIFAAALLWFFWRIGTPSLWEDELFTVHISSGGPRFIYQVIRGHLDFIHAPYYMMMWLWSRVFGISEISLRAPSAIAMAVAAAALFLIARRYTTLAGSVIAAAIFVVLPLTSKYAQDARSSGLIVAGVMVSTLLLHRSIETGNRRSWVGYSAALMFAALFSFLSLLILLPHAALIWNRVSVRTAAIAWLPSVLIATVMAAFSSRQLQQIAWIPAPTFAQLQDLLSQFAGFSQFVGSWRVDKLMLLIPIAVLLVWMVFSRRWHDFFWMLVAVSLPVVLWIVSYIQHVFTAQYLIFTLPFFALICAIVTARAHAIAAIAFFVGLAYLSFLGQLQVRSHDGHDDDFRAAQAMIASQALPGDGIVFDSADTRFGFEYYNARTPTVPLADPLGSPRGQDVLLRSTWRSEGSDVYLRDGDCSPDKLADLRRVWELQLFESPISSCGAGLRLVSTATVSTLTIRLFER